MDEKVISVYSDGIGHSVQVLGYEFGIEDRVIFRHITGDKVGKPTKAKLHYNAEHVYFVSRGRRYRLENFTRV